MYFITTLRICGNIVDDCRTIGMKSSYGDCFRDVMNNAVDMFENGYYKYAVISYIKEGFYPNICEQQWFKFNVESNDITIIDKPEEIGGYSPYIIG